MEVEYIETWREEIYLLAQNKFDGKTKNESVFYFGSLQAISFPEGKDSGFGALFCVIFMNHTDGNERHHF